MLNIFALFVLALGVETIFHTTTVFDCDTSTLWTSTKVPLAPTNSTGPLQKSVTSAGQRPSEPTSGSTVALVSSNTDGSGSSLPTSPLYGLSSSSHGSSSGSGSSIVSTKGPEITASSLKIASNSIGSTKSGETTLSGNGAAQLHPLVAFNVLFW